MGPTEFCPRKKLSAFKFVSSLAASVFEFDSLFYCCCAPGLYHGYRCPDKDVVAAETTMGTIAVFDYRTLHRGPGNTSNTSRPMVSLVYSLKWFLNSYAYANRALTNEAVLHQRRYWAAYMYHPDNGAFVARVYPLTSLFVIRRVALAGVIALGSYRSIFASFGYGQRRLPRVF